MKRYAQCVGKLEENAIDEKVDFILLAGGRNDEDYKDYGMGIFFSHQMGNGTKRGYIFLLYPT